jgi:hypothetical protein
MGQEMGRKNGRWKRGPEKGAGKGGQQRGRKGEKVDRKWGEIGGWEGSARFLARYARIIQFSNLRAGIEFMLVTYEVTSLIFRAHCAPPFRVTSSLRSLVHTAAGTQNVSMC